MKKKETQSYTEREEKNKISVELRSLIQSG
jgi:hypothetical protein